MAKVLVTGAAGMDGSHACDMLVGQNHEVYGMVRRHSVQSYPNIDHLLAKGDIRLVEADLCDIRSLEHAVSEVKPDFCLNFGAQSHVGSSFTQPEYTMDATGMGPMRLFEACRKHARNARIYQASSSEMLGNQQRTLGIAKADESTPLAPCSPYGSAKLTAHNWAKIYRQSYGLFIASGILFNHEGPRRGDLFVTRKITKAIARIKLGLQDKLVLGNLQAVRDWGYAPDYVAACWKMLQLDQPDDFVIATGEGHTVTEFAFAAQDASAMEGELEIESIPQEKRPTDIDYLVGDAWKAARILGWKPTVDFSQLVKIMVKHDLKLAEKEKEAVLAPKA